MKHLAEKLEEKEVEVYHLFLLVGSGRGLLSKF